LKVKLNQQGFICATALAVLLGGCATKQETAQNQQAAAEQKVAEAEQKVAEAKQGLAKAQETAAAERKLAEAEQKVAEAKQELNKARETGAQGSNAIGGGAVQPKAAPPEPPKVYTVAAGTPISVRTITPLSTKTAASGEPFEATLHQPIVVDGYTVAAKGATVKGVVTGSDPGGKVKGVASLTVSLASIETAGGQVVKIDTTDHTRLAPQSKEKDALKVGIGSGIGAAIGAIAGGGKGAAIGAGAGGAAGTGMVLATRGEAAVLPSESLITFKLRAPITVTAGK
jgi:hypothetical protein